MKKIFYEKRLLLFIFVSFFIFIDSSAFGQLPRLNFKSFTEKDGLSMDYVRSVCQDKDGFMWFGTPNGLDKFDGKNFTNYNKLLKDTLSGNYQTSHDILEDRDGIIWIATFSNGIILFDKKKETITRLKNDINDPASLSNNNVLDVFEDKDSNIWVATAGGGLDLWQKDYGGFIHFKHDPNNPNSIGSNYISSISSDSKGNLWILTQDGIVSKLDPKTMIFQNMALPFISHTINYRRSSSSVICVDFEDNVIIGSYFGLFIIDAQTSKIEHMPMLSSRYNVNLTVTSILEIQKGIIAIGTTFQGLYLFNIKTRELVNYSNSEYADYYLNNNSITSIYKSENDLVWLGSYNSGINMYNKIFSQFSQLAEITKSGKELFAGTRGTDFCIAPDNKIWIAAGEKIIAYDPTEKSAQQVLENSISSEINYLYNNNKGEIFIGTEDDGLIIYDFWRKNFKEYKNNPKDPNSIASNYIISVLQSIDNKIYLGYAGSGIDVIERSTNVVKHYKHEANNPSSLISDVISRILEDSSGRIWVGTQNGLCYYNSDKQNFTRYPLYLDKKNTIQAKTIQDIFEDSNGEIWVGTDRAIFKLNTDDQLSTVFTPENDSPYLVTNFMEDKHNNIWMTSFNKLFKLNSHNNKFTVYNFYNGNISPSFFGYNSLNANGQFFIGSLDRIITFDPETIVEDTLKPEIFITNFEINNSPVKVGSSEILSQHINFTKSVNLDYNHSSFAFAFAALEFSFPEKIRYAYMLENFDRDWIYSNSLNDRAVYTKVPPGKYLFKVKATDSKGQWFESGQKISISIQPPFWKTLVFRIFMMLFITAIIYSLFLLRNKQLMSQKKKLEATVKQRTLDLKNANISLEEQHEELLQQHETLNQMSEKIIEQNQSLEKHYAELERLVDERTAELKLAKNKAEESDKLKSAFLANMSHEIRTPMNAIIGFASLLREKELTFEERNEFVEIINASSNSLLILVDDIIDLSMIEANQLIIRNEIFDVNEFLNYLYSTFLQLNRHKNIEFVLNNKLDDQKLQINSDKVRIKQILTNLISNALKFTNIGTIELGLKRIDKNIAFYVRDTGIGIPEKDIDTIFERFRKSEDDKNVLFRGAGLGLAISVSLAKLMEGDLIVESELGKGSVFTFLLPDKFISNEKSVKPENPVLSSDVSTKEKNILVAEDEIANFIYIKSVLKENNIKIFHAKNGLEAVRMIESGVYFHLILMDIKMPKMDGFEATRIIKSKNPDQVIIAVTAYAHQEEKLKFMTAGFDDYLIKPVKPNELKNVLNK